MGVPHAFRSLNALSQSRYRQLLRVLWMRDSSSETEGSIYLLVLYEGHFSNSSNATCSSSCVFITIRPYHASKGVSCSRRHVRRQSTGVIP